jgi:hypothetical protein
MTFVLKLVAFLALMIVVIVVTRRDNRRGNGGAIRRMTEEVKTHAAVRKQQLEQLTRFKSEHTDATRPVP